jgi:predicted nuclease with TOPRIM domain
MQSALDEVRGSRDYFADVIAYYNQKLHWFTVIEEGLDLSREDDYDFFMSIQPEKEHLWTMLEDLNSQLVDVQAQLSSLEFEQFILEDTFVNEDESNAMADIERQRGWYEDAVAEAEDL